MSTTNHYPTGMKAMMQNNETSAQSGPSHSQPHKNQEFFSEDALDRKLVYSNNRAIQSGRHLAEAYRCDENPFRTEELNAIFRAAKLTPRQLEVVKLRMRGLTFEEIGKLWIHTKQNSFRVYQQAVRKLRRARGVYPFAGLNQVYRQEIHRGTGH